MKTNFTLKLIIVLLSLFLNFSFIFARSGGRSGGSSFSSRRSSSSSSSTGYSRNHSGSSSYNHTTVASGDYEEDSILDNFIIFIIFGIIVFFWTMRKVITTKLTFFKIKISIKNEYQEDIINSLISYHKLKLKDQDNATSNIIKLLLDNYEKINIYSIENSENMKASEARNLLRDSTENEEKLFEKLEINQKGDFTLITFLINFKPKNAPAFNFNNQELLENLSKLKEDEIYYTRTALAQNVEFSQE
jgi:hypothetical protein